MEGNNEISFKMGKYKNRLVIDIMNEDPSYCQWYLFNDKIYKTTYIRNLLEEKFKNPHEYWFNFGDFKGQTLSEVYKIEPEYLQHLLIDEYVSKNCPLLIKKINELVFK